MIISFTFLYYCYTIICPLLLNDQVGLNIPNQVNSTPLPVRVGRFMKYFEEE